LEVSFRGNKSEFSYFPGGYPLILSMAKEMGEAMVDGNKIRIGCENGCGEELGVMHS
jgi:hypothetical protein